ANDAVVRDVQGEERRPADVKTPVDPEQDRNPDYVVGELVKEGRVERLVGEVARRPVLRIDLQAPWQVGRLAEELLVEPVADAADPLRQQEPRGDGVHEQPHALTRAMDDPSSGEDAEEDSAPNAEPALPDRERPPPLVRHLV